MISSPTVKTLIEENTTIQTNIGSTIEYNMNSMVDNITVVGSDYVRADGAKPYQNFFLHLLLLNRLDQLVLA